MRSDTIILLRLDPSKGATAVMSLPRDLKVSIPGHGTDKINAAYAIGGPALSVKTVRHLLGIPINHVINVNFGGFRRAVDRLGCVYTDVDRRYFNDNSPPFGGGGDYATIDIKAGYQKLCGQDALDFVRYRHFDTDLVRAARQQQFLSDAKDQIGVGKVFSDRKALLRIFGRYTQTDIKTTNAILRLLKLAVESAQKPVQEVAFPGDITGDFVTVTTEHLARRQGPVHERDRDQGPARHGPGRPGDDHGDDPEEDQGEQAPRVEVGDAGPRAARRRPRRARTRRSSSRPSSRSRSTTRRPCWRAASLVTDHSRAYDLYDRSRQHHHAYRMVIEGATAWASTTASRAPTGPGRRSWTTRASGAASGGRTYELFFDGNRLRLVAWRSGRAVYWISNTLLHSIGNQQMLGLARSVAKVN